MCRLCGVCRMRRHNGERSGRWGRNLFRNRRLAVGPARQLTPPASWLGYGEEHTPDIVEACGWGRRPEEYYTLHPKRAATALSGIFDQLHDRLEPARSRKDFALHVPHTPSSSLVRRHPDPGQRERGVRRLAVRLPEVRARPRSGRRPLAATLRRLRLAEGDGDGPTGRRGQSLPARFLSGRHQSDGPVRLPRRRHPPQARGGYTS